MTVHWQPARFPRVSPYLVVDDVRGLIEFTKRVFDARPEDEVAGRDGEITHAEMKIGDSMILMGRAPEPSRRQTAMLYVYVEDADATYGRAIEAGAESLQEPRDAFYGDRNAGVKDRWGNSWWVATHVEDVPPDELARRAAEAHGGGS